MKIAFAVSVLTAALACGPAFAQSAQPADRNTPAATSSTSSSANKLMLKGNWRASKLMGLDVYNENNEKLGDVNEIILDKSGKVTAVVIGVGGFLGMGEHDVAVYDGPAEICRRAGPYLNHDDHEGNDNRHYDGSCQLHHDHAHHQRERLGAGSRSDERDQRAAQGDASV